MTKAELIEVKSIYPIKFLNDFLECKYAVKTFLGFCHSTLRPIQFVGDRELLKYILERYNKTIDAPDQVFLNIEKITDEKTFFVVTGQQPGFLTGPLYTIYKALSAIIYAGKFSSNDIRLIPLFWNASEDHDALEANNIAVQNKNKTIEFISVDFDESFGKSLEKIKLSDINVKDALDRLLNVLPETNFTNSVFYDIVYSELKKSRFWGEFFSRLLTRLLGELGLIIIEPYVFRPYLKKMFSSLIENALRFNEMFINTTNKLRSLGYKPKIHKDPHIVGLFYIDKNGFRHRILLREDGFYELSNGSIYSKDELLTLLHHHPDRFSTNAIFRPIAQDKMIPTYIYVGGPSEIIYHSQIKDLYPSFNLVQPNIMFRMGGTLIEKHVYKVIKKYNINLAEVKNIDKLIKRLLLKDSSVRLKKHFEKIRRALKELQEELSSINKDLGKRVEYKAHSVEKILKAIEDTYVRFAKQENRIIVSQLIKIKKHLFPNNEPQEKVFNIFQYLNKYSLDLIQHIKKVFASYNPGSHVVVKCWTF